MYFDRYVRLAILGSRGIPAEFGGFETFAEQLAVRLVERGVDVTVFCEATQSYRASSYKGVKLKYLSTPRIAGLRSTWFDVVSIVKSLRGYDVVYMLGYNAAYAFFLPRLFRTKIWVNMDGLEWKRAKWSRGAKAFLRTMEFLAVKFASKIIADARGISDHLKRTYGVTEQVKLIPYGALPVEEPPDPALLEEYGVDPDRYYLVVSRLEPENHVLDPDGPG